MSDVIPLPDLALACRSVLDRELRPMPVSELTQEGMAVLGIARESINWSRVREDVRLWLLCGGRRGMAYTGPPHYCGIVADWFRRPLFVMETTRLDVTRDVLETATVETALRYRYIQNKYGRTDEGHALKIHRGFVKEVTISRWVKGRWPSLWCPPDNANRYSDWCGHDFKLQMPLSGLWTVDVAGPNGAGEFGAVRDKPSADIHLLAEEDAAGVWLRGVVSGREFHSGRFAWESAWPITRFIVQLNAECAGMSLSELIKRGAA